MMIIAHVTTYAGPFPAQHPIRVALTEVLGELFPAASVNAHFTEMIHLNGPRSCFVMLTFVYSAPSDITGTEEAVRKAIHEKTGGHETYCYVERYP